MLKRLRRWLGWDSDEGSFRFSAIELPVRPPPAPPTAVNPVQRPTSTKAVDEIVDSPRLLEILDNPELSLERPNDDGFDPYNTGAFNRSTSWEKISRTKR